MGRLPPWIPSVAVQTLWAAALVLAAFGAVAAYAPRPPVPTVTPIRCPVRGRWIALNSPAAKVPSHGMHSHGQTYAIDLLYEPQPGTRPGFGDGRGLLAPAEFPAFGQPVRAPVAATVVRVLDGARDHRSRTSWPTFLYMLLEGNVRALGPSGWILGNHVVLALDDGSHAALAHLRRRSIRVAEGQRVQAGQVIAECGNSGNSSEPHLHLQVMDHPNPVRAAGLPFVFTDIAVESHGADDAAGQPASQPAVPGNLQAFHGG